MAIVGSEAYGYGGAGTFGCITATFVVSLGWREKGWDNKVMTILVFCKFVLFNNYIILLVESRKNEFCFVVEFFRTNIFWFDGH